MASFQNIKDKLFGKKNIKSIFNQTYRCAFCNKEFDTQKKAESCEKKDRATYTMGPIIKIDKDKKIMIKIMTLFRELNKLKEELPKSKINEIIKLEREIDRYYELGKITEEKYNSILKRIKKPTDYEILLKKELKVLSDGLNNMESEFYDKLFEEVEKFTKSKEQNIKKFNVLLKKIKTTGYKYGISKNHKLCRHRWIKVSGPINMGDGEFGQKLRCYVCGKTKTRIS